MTEASKDEAPKMIYKIYAIKDLKTGFEAPVVYKSDELIVRVLVEQLSRGAIWFVDEKQLYQIGIMDMETGAIAEKYRLVGNLSDYVGKVKDVNKDT